MGFDHFWPLAQQFVCWGPKWTGLERRWCRVGAARPTGRVGCLNWDKTNGHDLYDFRMKCNQHAVSLLSKIAKLKLNMTDESCPFIVCPANFTKFWLFKRHCHRVALSTKTCWIRVLQPGRERPGCRWVPRHLDSWVTVKKWLVTH